MLYHGDCLQEMKQIPDGSVDTIITDPPYGLSFMGKKWDYDVPAVEIWQEALRVLKPGGTALIFAGSRTQHRMAVNVEDAGFILKDCIMWLYGSGFPKATDISKQLDKGHERKVVGYHNDNGRKTPKHQNTHSKFEGLVEIPITAPATPEAKTWNGWKSHGLKPAYEPILVAMKPNEGTYANNALVHGVSGLNIDGGRIPTNPEVDDMLRTVDRKKRETDTWKDGSGFKNEANSLTGVRKDGRFPANVILDEEAGRMLDEQTGQLKSGAMKKPYKYTNNGHSLGQPAGETKQIHESNSGGASRFFYCAKASKSERGGTKHPTVKPSKLMEYLCTLTKTPTGGTVLDPFMGSGSTGIACVKTGRGFIGIEREDEFYNDAKKRIKEAEDSKGLFGGIK